MKKWTWWQDSCSGTVTFLTFRYSSGPITTEAGGQQSSGKGAETSAPAHKANKKYQRVKILCSSYYVGLQGNASPWTTWLVLKGTFLLPSIFQMLCGQKGEPDGDNGHWQTNSKGKGTIKTKKACQCWKVCGLPQYILRNWKKMIIFFSLFILP